MFLKMEAQNTETQIEIEFMRLGILHVSIEFYCFIVFLFRPVFYEAEKFFANSFGANLVVYDYIIHFQLLSGI